MTHSGFQDAGRKSQKKWKASMHVQSNGKDVPLAQWMIDECNARKAGKQSREIDGDVAVDLHLCRDTKQCR